MEIFKDRLREGLSYPLKPSVLAATIEANGVETPVTLYQRTETWWTEGILFRADFYPPGLYYLNPGEVLHVTCRSVRSEERQRARSFLEGLVLPAFVQWIRRLEGLEFDSTLRREKQAFARAWPEA
jgi:hypothetical protein